MGRTGLNKNMKKIIFGLCFIATISTAYADESTTQIMQLLDSMQNTLDNQTVEEPVKTDYQIYMDNVKQEIYKPYKEEVNIQQEVDMYLKQQGYDDHLHYNPRRKY